MNTNYANVISKNAYLNEKQDGGRRYLDYRKSVAISLLMMNQSSPNSVEMLSI